MIHNGTILAKNGIVYNDIKFKISFDIIIELISGTKYTGTVQMELPVGNIIQEGTSNKEKIDFSDVIFKRN